MSMRHTYIRRTVGQFTMAEISGQRTIQQFANDIVIPSIPVNQ
jgi:hypothetical protein